MDPSTKHQKTVDLEVIEALVSWKLSLLHLCPQTVSEEFQERIKSKDEDLKINPKSCSSLTSHLLKLQNSQLTKNI